MKLSAIILNEESDSSDTTSNRYELKTYGDLKKVLSAISKKKKKGFLVDKGREVGLDFILGLFPGAQAAKTAFDVLRGLTNQPDSKRSSTWLGKLDVDDEMSKIIDDTVENGFLKTMFKVIDNKPNEQELEDNFNMNDELAKYLAEKYKNRTLTGY